MTVILCYLVYRQSSESEYRGWHYISRVSDPIDFSWNIKKDKGAVRMYNTQAMPFDRDDFILLGILLGGDYDNKVCIFIHTTRLFLHGKPRLD